MSETLWRRVLIINSALLLAMIYYAGERARQMDINTSRIAALETDQKRQDSEGTIWAHAMLTEILTRLERIEKRLDGTK